MPNRGRAAPRSAPAKTQWAKSHHSFTGHGCGHPCTPLTGGTGRVTPRSAPAKTPWVKSHPSLTGHGCACTGGQGITSLSSGKNPLGKKPSQPHWSRVCVCGQQGITSLSFGKTSEEKSHPSLTGHGCACAGSGARTDRGTVTWAVCRREGGTATRLTAEAMVAAASKVEAEERSGWRGGGSGEGGAERRCCVDGAYSATGEGSE